MTELVRVGEIGRINPVRAGSSRPKNQFFVEFPVFAPKLIHYLNPMEIIKEFRGPYLLKILISIIERKWGFY